MKFGMGQAVRRTEDIRFVTGHGLYTDDITRPGQLHAFFVRSPHAHARILSIDTTQARAHKGVIDVLTFADIDAMGAGHMPCLAPLKNGDGSDFKHTNKALLADGKVRFVGEAVAMVVAETQAIARDAAELVVVDYNMLEAAGNVETASRDGAPLLWENAPGNLCFDWHDGDRAATDAAFATAKHIITARLVQNRIIAHPMETRAALGEYDGASETFTLTTGNQGITMMRSLLAVHLLKVPLEKLRVVSPDVGGGFGMKMFCYPEQPLTLLAAKKTGRPVKWSADRSESFLADAHGRDTVFGVEGAFDGDGRILAVRLDNTANLGGYLSQYAPFIPTLAGARVWGGVYRVPALFARVRGFFTNTAPVDAYRGAGRPEAAYFMDRLLDMAAQKFGLDPIEIRRRNLLSPEELPRKNWNGFTYDCGTFVRNLEDAATKADVAGFAARRMAAKAKGKLRGLGVAYYVEITAADREPAAIRFTDNGGVEVIVGTQSNGQGHETTFAQVVAERLGVAFESVTIKYGDTADHVFGGGTGGSRSLHMASGAIFAASDEVVKKGTIAAADMLESEVSHISFTVRDGVGKFEVARSNRSATLPEVALHARRHGLESLDSTGLYKAQAPTFPNGAHVCEIEIDADTGVPQIVRYTVVDDFGRVINPMIVAGQVHGGVVQGIGQALYENCLYDADSGQLVTGSFMDYCMPRADDLPSIDFSYNEVPTKTNPLGAKGCGEAGTVGALGAVMNAVVDALRDFGVVHVDMPATSEKLWRIIHGRKVAA